MGFHNDALGGGETQGNTKIQGVDRLMNNSSEMEVMVTSHKKVKESQPEDYGIVVALRIMMAREEIRRIKT